MNVFKKICLTGILSLAVTCILAQVSIYPEPEKGFEERISNYVSELHVVDTHEHMLLPENLAEWTSLDFMLLFSFYSSDDIKSAGMEPETYNLLLTDSLPVAEKWKIIEPFWNKAKNTAYCRNSLLIARDLFGAGELNASTVQDISNRISTAYENPDWLYELLNRSRIDYVINDGYWIEGGGPREFKGDKFRYVARFENYITLWSKKSISDLADKCKCTINTLDDLETALSIAFSSAVEKGIVGIKTGIAYSRKIYFENRKRKEAEDVFNELMTEGGSGNISYLQDYMMHRLIKLAEKYNLPMIFHTGLQAGNGNNIENSKPTHLVNLLKQYPNVNFVFYHGGFPYGGELTTIIKNFPNAWLDLSWLYIISPGYAKHFLHEWLETIPANKIMAFGGDGRNGEGTYGHLVFAKQIVTEVLVEKVRSGYFKEQEAKDIAKMLFYDNAVEFYHLS